MRQCSGCIVALTIAVTSLSAYGQQYPSRPIRVIVPFTPGGGTDFIARLLAPKLTAVLGQQFVVENRPGAGSTIGTEAALKSPGDGYTLLLTSGSYTVAPSLYKLRYDPIRDMTPIVQPDDGPFVIVIHPSLPPKSVRQLVALARSRPGEINYASAGVGSITHLSTELFSMVSGIRCNYSGISIVIQSIKPDTSCHA